MLDSLVGTRGEGEEGNEAPGEVGAGLVEPERISGYPQLKGLKSGRSRVMGGGAGGAERELWLINGWKDGYRGGSHPTGCPSNLMEG